MLTDAQLAIVKSTVPLLESGGEALTTHFYKMLMRDYPQVRPLFNRAHQASGDQPRALANGVLMYARHIDRLEELGPLAAQLPAGRPWPAKVAIGIVGEGSRLALRAHGVDAACATLYGPQRADKMDSEELLKSLPLAQLRGQRALIVRGQSGRDFLSEALQQQGVTVEYLTAYRRTAPRLDAQNGPLLLDLLDGGADWVITSSEALRNLVDLTRLAGG